MVEKVCFNPACGGTEIESWTTGWVLRCGRMADLCHTCGSAYEQRRFCEVFHSGDSGWRSCSTCNKQVHCGCIASRYLYALLDTGGVECVDCCRKNTSDMAEASSWKQLPSVESSIGMDQLIENNENRQMCGSFFTMIDKHMLETTKNICSDLDIHGESGRMSSVPESMEDMNDTDSRRIDLAQRNICMKGKNTENVQDLDLLTCVECSLENMKGKEQCMQLDIFKASAENKAFETSASACVNISVGCSTLNSAVESSNKPMTPMLGLLVSSRSPVEEKEQFQSKSLVAYPQHQQCHQLLPKPTHLNPYTVSEQSKDMFPQLRIARPPSEGRGRNQLLPRYWPRITDQELEQISGDSNSTIVPLFEKVLSASDAGRIGRLVLPKACAEAYFPPISQAEGVPLKIQDVKGKDWLFQFRFWPNNNSRMYVLEGVTPCIQSMHLQAGDTVTFSRLDPEGKLVMGFRKASTSASTQEVQPSEAVTGVSLNESNNSGGFETISGLTGFSGLLVQSMKENREPQINASGDKLNHSDTDISLYKNDKVGGKTKKGLVFESVVPQDKKGSFDIGSKYKRLRIDNEDVLELKLTWEEAQDLLCPPPKVVPSIVIIEDHAFEEYGEPPVFGKRTFFTTDQYGKQDQWAQCDYCYSWRRLPIGSFLPARWTCANNTWDPQRASCSSPQEISSEELEDLLQHTTDASRQEAVEGKKILEASSALDTLATAAVLGDYASPSPAPTTKHPRHRPGCTCIVCIQPPSGKGPKHKPTCTCNVCMTVKRRFKTLMMRRKKRQSEQAAENARKKLTWGNDDTDFNSDLNRQLGVHPLLENNSRQGDASLAFSGGVARVNHNLEIEIKLQSDLNLKGDYSSSGIGKEKNTIKGQIDLNSQPEKEEEPTHSHVSMVKLVQDASLPLYMYLEEQGLTSLMGPQQINIPAAGLQRVECEQHMDEQSFIPPSQTPDFIM